MKHSEIKRRPLADVILSGLEPESAPYRALDGGGCTSGSSLNGQKSWNFRYKKPDGKWSWLGLGSYPEVSGFAARQKAAELRGDLADGKNPIVSKQARKAADLVAANSTFESLAREWIEIRVSMKTRVCCRFICGCDARVCETDTRAWRRFFRLPKTPARTPVFA